MYGDLSLLNCRKSETAIEGNYLAITPSTKADGHLAPLLPSDVALIGALVLILVPMALMFAGPVCMTADTPILAIMSLQRLTLFFWGQNRLINLVPVLASPIPWPDTNLCVQILLYGGGFIGLLALLGWVVASTILRSSARLDAWLCFAALLFAFFVFSSRSAVHVFVSAGQPYGLSGLLMGVGLTTLLRCGWPGTVRQTLAAVAMMLGGGLNPSLALVSVGVCGLAMVGWPKVRLQALAALALSLGSCWFWLKVGRRYPGQSGYGTFPHTQILAHALQATRSILQGFAPKSVLAGAVVAAVASIALTCLPQRTPRPRWLLLVAAAIFAACWAVLFAQNQWVLLNLWNFRYFYPVTLVIPMLLTVPVAGLAMRGGYRLRLCLTVALLAATPVLILAPWRPLERFPVFANVADHVAAARAEGIHMVAGSYWTVWPTVFLLLHDGPAFGIEELRAIDNRPALLRELEEMESTGRPVRSLCVDADASRCLAQAALVTGRNWREASGACGPRCSLIELSETRH